jgi:hypothetical protein
MSMNYAVNRNADDLSIMQPICFSFLFTMTIKETGRGSVDWIHLAQNRDQLWAVNMVTNVRFSQDKGNVRVITS